ncbi:MAG: hypothetical protein LBR75_00365 [Prevotellaceae bacterium]|jgi:hypothetical protein|nr:hypothetical protein [Prevotellaceae bacterium]
MEQIKIYTSRKKSFGILVLAIIMTAAAAWMFVNAEDMRHGVPIFFWIVGGIGLLFFSFGIFVAISRLVKNRLFLVIDDEGIDVYPTKLSTSKIAWKHIEGFSDICIHGSTLIVIYVKNPDYWIANERSAARRKMKKFNLDNCGSPFCINANAARISHAELRKLLNDSFGRFIVTDFTGI